MLVCLSYRQSLERGGDSLRCFQFPAVVCAETIVQGQYWQWQGLPGQSEAFLLILGDISEIHSEL